VHSPCRFVCRAGFRARWYRASKSSGLRGSGTRSGGATGTRHTLFPASRLDECGRGRRYCREKACYAVPELEGHVANSVSQPSCRTPLPIDPGSEAILSRQQAGSTPSGMGPIFHADQWLHLFHTSRRIGGWLSPCGNPASLSRAPGRWNRNVVPQFSKILDQRDRFREVLFQGSNLNGSRDGGSGIVFHGARPRRLTGMHCCRQPGTFSRRRCAAQLSQFRIPLRCSGPGFYRKSIQDKAILPPIWTRCRGLKPRGSFGIVGHPNIVPN